MLVNGVNIEHCVLVDGWTGGSDVGYVSHVAHVRKQFLLLVIN